MPRRTHRQAKRGQLFASEWPEWHVNCAVEDCNETLLVSALGECMTLKEAEKAIRSKQTEDDSKGWRYSKGLWYCPQHNPRRGFDAQSTR